MYECPNCSGNVKFDIRSQQLRCGHCRSEFDPYSFAGESDAEETYESAVYVCPQCGAKMHTDENSVTEFCIYCGGANILTGKLTRQKRPGYIIPFCVTKEDCISAYQKRMQRAIFAPPELKNPEYLQRFQGIYVPYWSYRVVYNGQVNLVGDKTIVDNGCRFDEKYELKCDIDAYFRGFSHDAAAGVADDISEKLAPYSVSDMKVFNPSYLSGFYADVFDVSSDLYKEEYVKLANEEMLSAIRHSREFSKFYIEPPISPEMYEEKLHTKIEAIDSTMYPIWFMTYRNKDRIVYSAVNGQSGKVVTDIPIDSKKYILGSVILAIPFFCLFSLFLDLEPMSALAVTLLLALFASVIYYYEMSSIVKKETLLEDRGYLSGLGQDYKPKKVKPITTNRQSMGGMVLAFFLLCNFMVLPLLLIMLSSAAMSVAVLFIAEVIVTACGCKQIQKLSDMEKLIRAEEKSRFGETKSKQENFSSMYLGFIMPLLLCLISWIIVIIDPANDGFYYCGALGCTASVLFTICMIINKYNFLSTRKLPNFHDRGDETDE